MNTIGSNIIRSSHYTRSLIEASRDPLVVISLDGIITDMNQAMIDVVGKSREQLIDSEFASYFTDPLKAQRVYKEVIKEGFIVDYQLTITEGMLQEVLFNGSVYRDLEGKVIGAVIVGRDVSEQNRIEGELREAKIDAEFSASVAVAAKAKAEVATVEAENAMKSKQQFLSNMSHEIRTPLNAIIGFTKVLLKGPINDKQNEYLSAIKISGDALIMLIDDILDLAKVNSGKMTFETIPFNLYNSMTDVLQLFQTKTKEKNLELVSIIDNKINEIIIGDPLRLHQIMVNLISNAIKFTSVGKITINVTLISQDTRQATLEFSVQDTGIGIAAAELETIFENFQQATSDTSRVFGGTGLGLAIVKQLVETQGGTVRVQSVPSVGSTFSFVMSFQKTKKKLEPEVVFVQPELDTYKYKVLVVEDTPINQLLMKTLLDDFGFQEDLAANGKIAIEMLKKEHYDIILMDIQMPQMNGFEAAHIIRNVLKMDIPIIALTADVTTTDVDKCRAAGMNDYIAKPIDERILRAKIWEHLNPAIISSPPVANAVETKTSNSVIDLSYLKKRTNSNPLLMKEIILSFLDQTPPILLAVKSGLKEKNISAINAAVHKALPSLSIVGMGENVEKVARRILELTGSKKLNAETIELILELEQACVLACKELKKEYLKLN